MSVVGTGVVGTGWCPSQFSFQSWNTGEHFVDDLTGLPLPPELCKIASQKEIDDFRSRGVWSIRSVNEARSRMGRAPIICLVRWVETIKGDDDHPNFHSRFVAREIRRARQNAIFAPTPPPESLRMVSTMAATGFVNGPAHSRDPYDEERTQIPLVDISCARTSEDDPIYVELRPEAGNRRGECTLLKRHMCGTRRAAEGW